MAGRMSYRQLVKAAAAETAQDYKNRRAFDFKKILVPFRMLLHPFDATGCIKYEGGGSVLLANIMAVLFFVAAILRSVGYGFVFRGASEESFNLFPIFVQTIGILLMFLLASWSLSSLMDGEGRLSEIWTALCYSLMPVLLLTPVLLLLTNISVLEESALIALIEGVMNLWTIVLVVLSTLVVQQFSLGKTIGMTLLTVLGMVCIVFLIILFFSLFQQLYIFIKSVFDETMLRT